jgi:hypothetical protein
MARVQSKNDGKRLQLSVFLQISPFQSNAEVGASIGAKTIDSSKIMHSRREMADPARFELTTSAFGGRARLLISSTSLDVLTIRPRGLNCYRAFMCLILSAAALRGVLPQRFPVVF